MYRDGSIADQAVAQTHEPFEIIVLSPGADDFHRLTANEFPDESPKWAQYGMRILFNSLRGVAPVER
jgi:hypothetical protein